SRGHDSAPKSRSRRMNFLISRSGVSNRLYAFSHSDEQHSCGAAPEISPARPFIADKSRPNWSVQIRQIHLESITRCFEFAGQDTLSLSEMEAARAPSAPVRRQGHRPNIDK